MAAASSSTPAAGPSSSLPSSSSHYAPTFDSIDSAISSLQRGQFVVVLDSEDRENEGDLIIPSRDVTTEQMAWLIRHSSGFVCISIHPARIAQLDLPMMFPDNQEPHKTAYTVTVDYRHGTTTGISAHDRALTSRKLSEFEWDQSTGSVRATQIPQQPRDAAVAVGGAGKVTTKNDFSRPGHLCPLRYTEGGVRRRMGHTEASVDLAVAAGFPPAALLCELVDPSSPVGAIASRDACFRFAKEHGLKIITIEALKQWREQREGPSIPGVEPVKSELLDQERGVSIEEQAVVGPRS